MPFNIGPWEMGIFLVIVLIIFGPKNLPKLGKSIGSAIRDFKSGLGGVDQEIRSEMDKPAIETKTPAETHAVEAKSAAHAEEKKD